MLTKISKRVASLLTIVMVSFLAFLFGPTSSVLALSAESNGDNPLEIVIVPSDDTEMVDSQENNQQNQELTMEQIFAAEQVFPLVTGFGPN